MTGNHDRRAAALYGHASLTSEETAVIIELSPVAYVRGGRALPEDDAWGAVEARIELEARFSPQALTGLEAFSHLEVVYFFHRADPARAEVRTRHPRGNPAWPNVGIFAQRARDRPNGLGVSVCEILEVSGRALRVRGLDAIDGTPVLDLKPVMRAFLPRGAVREPAWAAQLMSMYW
jgi:tRNA-Thr(GGU) m(6)t(6)A37 methyltransferase TsaA